MTKKYREAGNPMSITIEYPLAVSVQMMPHADNFGNNSDRFQLIIKTAQEIKVEQVDENTATLEITGNWELDEFLHSMWTLYKMDKAGIL